MIELEWLDGAKSEQNWIAQRLTKQYPHIQIALCSYRAPVVLLPSAQWENFRATIPGEESKISVMRRYGGGGAVLAGPWLHSVNVWFPSSDLCLLKGLTEIRSWIGSMYVSALHRFGVGSKIVKSQSPPSPFRPFLPAVCFGQTGVDEITDLLGRKMVGFSLHRGRYGTWVGGGTLVGECDWSILCKSLGLSRAHALQLSEITTLCACRPATLEAAIIDEMLCSFRSGFAQVGDFSQSR